MSKTGIDYVDDATLIPKRRINRNYLIVGGCIFPQQLKVANLGLDGIDPRTGIPISQKYRGEAYVRAGIDYYPGLFLYFELVVFSFEDLLVSKNVS